MVKTLNKIISMVIAMALVISGLIVTDVTTAQAAVKLNKKSASIYVGETVQLKLSGAKSVSWSSSNKKIATVTGKGLVKGVKKGTANIKATDKKTKKTYTCKVTVKALQSLNISQDDIGYSDNGLNIWYNGEQISGAIYYVDGKKVKINNDSIWSDADEQGVFTCVKLDRTLTEGEHTFTIQKKGYKPVTVTFIYEELKTDVDGMFTWDPFVEGDTLYVGCKPELEGKEFKVTLNGQEVTAENGGMTGDGDYVFNINISNLSAGEYTLTVTAEGLPEGSAKVTI